MEERLPDLLVAVAFFSGAASVVFLSSKSVLAGLYPSEDVFQLKNSSLPVDITHQKLRQQRRQFLLQQHYQQQLHLP